ncbi:hypothetical protein [Egbenema bharatensis]|uniref:hypothetical protein n=1 Tax=Egbenema bharatensis TaxID=3463334 RepID=UPI003A83AFF0
MNRLIFTSFSALLLSALLAPVANARTHTTTTQAEAGLPTMRVLNQYNPRDNDTNWQPNNAHTDPGQAITVRTDTTAVDTQQIGQAQPQPGTQPGTQQPGVQPPQTPQPGIQPGVQQPQTPQPDMQQPGMQQPGVQQPGVQRQPGMMGQEGRSLPTMRVLNQYNPRDHERDWQPNSPRHDIVSDRRTIEELRFGGQPVLDARDRDNGVL